MNVENFMRLDLTYSNKHLEEQYQKWKMNYQKPVLKIVLLYGLLIGVFSWSLNPFDRPIQIGNLVIMIIIMIIVNISVVTIARKRPYYSENLIIFLTLYYLIGLMESTLPNRAYWNEIMYFITGMNLSIILVTSILCKSSWKKSSAIVALINILCCFRYAPFELNYTM